MGFARKETIKKMAEKKLSRKKQAKTLAWHSPYAKISQKIEKKMFYISTLEHSFQPSLNSSVGRAGWLAKICQRSS